jgi:uncharacterized membrane protein YidH (DUF202 family)
VLDDVLELPDYAADAKHGRWVLMASILMLLASIGGLVWLFVMPPVHLAMSWAGPSYGDPQPNHGHSLLALLPGWFVPSFWGVIMAFIGIFVRMVLRWHGVLPTKPRTRRTPGEVIADAFDALIITCIVLVTMAINHVKQRSRTMTATDRIRRNIDLTYAAALIMAGLSLPLLRWGGAEFFVHADSSVPIRPNVLTSGILLLLIAIVVVGVGVYWWDSERPYDEPMPRSVFAWPFVAGYRLLRTLIAALLWGVGYVQGTVQRLLTKEPQPARRPIEFMSLGTTAAPADRTAELLLVRR